MTLEDTLNKYVENPFGEEPFVPSHAILVVSFGSPHILYHQGTELNYWFSDVDKNPADLAGDGPLEDGVFVWSGYIRSWKDYWGVPDADLEATEWRPITKEEWASFVADETVWDHEEMHEWLTWNHRMEKMQTDSSEK